MKKNLKQALVPLAVMVFGAAAAFTTNAMKQSDKAEAVMDAYYYDITKPINSRCVKVEVDHCTNIVGSICTDSNLRPLWSDRTENNQDLTCTYQLFKL